MATRISPRGPGEAWRAPAAGAATIVAALLAAALPALADVPEPTGATLPSGRAKAMVAVVGADIYLLGGDASGGCSPTSCKTNEIVRFSPATGTATTLGDHLPARLGSAAVASDGSKVYLFGGCLDLPTCYTDDVIRFTPPSTVDSTSVPPLPTPRSGARAVWMQGNAYIFGGFPGSGQEILRYNPGTNNYENRTSLPAYAGGMGVVTDGSVAYLFGGYDGAAQYFNTILKYDPATNQIETLSLTLPSGRTEVAAVWVDGAAYLFGGRLSTDNDRTDQVLRFTPSPPTLEIMGLTLGTPREGVSAAFHGGTVYLLGGRDAGGPLAAIDRFVPTTNAAPTALFNVVVNGLTVTVDASASTDADGRVVSYAWSWGDSTAAGTGSRLTHTYAAAGPKAITLTVTDDQGAHGTKAQSVTLTAGPTTSKPPTTTPGPRTTAAPTAPGTGQDPADDGTSGGEDGDAELPPATTSRGLLPGPGVTAFVACVVAGAAVLRRRP